MAATLGFDKGEEKEKNKEEEEDEESMSIFDVAGGNDHQTFNIDDLVSWSRPSISRGDLDLHALEGDLTSDVFCATSPFK
ncbi:hypothetical protein L484_023494 [Morus notabilis]|uniref:Uncharacterized protein n=1 Tax=Morus notabilis TaxID=981085 RepID=W9RLK0_9ROSA|nr:hypothetical protein L484_023494 [Morus notabilis]